MREGTRDPVGRVSGEIEMLRQDLGSLLSELDRRRRELLDLRLQARRHPVVVAVAAGAAALMLGGLLAAAVRRRRRPPRRIREARRALARLLDHPERVAAEPNALARIATAAGIAAGSALARRLVHSAVTRGASQVKAAEAQTQGEGRA